MKIFSFYTHAQEGSCPATNGKQAFRCSTFTALYEKLPSAFTLSALQLIFILLKIWCPRERNSGALRPKFMLHLSLASQLPSNLIKHFMSVALKAT
jgi:hypothetical protein